LIREYFDVDWDVVWATVKNDLPQLKQQIRGLVEAAREARDQRGVDPPL
jgi:uncharacterized protein with HEPN domain